MSQIGPIVFFLLFFLWSNNSVFCSFFILRGRNPLFTKKGGNFRNRDIWTKQGHIICSKTILVEIRGLQDVSETCQFFCYMWRLPLSPVNFGNKCGIGDKATKFGTNHVDYICIELNYSAKKMFSRFAKKSKMAASIFHNKVLSPDPLIFVNMSKHKKLYRANCNSHV